MVVAAWTSRRGHAAARRWRPNRREGLPFEFGPSPLRPSQASRAAPSSRATSSTDCRSFRSRMAQPHERVSAAGLRWGRCVEVVERTHGTSSVLDTLWVSPARMRRLGLRGAELKPAPSPSAAKKGLNAAHDEVKFESTPAPCATLGCRPPTPRTGVSRLFCKKAQTEEKKRQRAILTLT